MSDEVDITPPVESTIDDTRKKEHSAFANDVLKLSLGTAFVQIESVLVSMVFTRLFSPADYGVSTLFGSITSILAVLVCLRYEAAVMLPRTKEEGANVFASALLFAVLSSLVLFPVFIIGRDWIADLLRSPQLASYLWLVPVGTFLAGLTTLMNFWNSRSRRYVRQSSNRIINQMVMDGSRFVLALSGQISGGSIIFSILAGSFVSNFQLAIRTWRDDSQLFLKSINLPQMLEVIKRYKKFPLYTSWAALLNVASTQMPSFFLAAFFSTEVAGFYGVGQRILRIPISLVGAAIGQVFYQRAARARHEGGLARLVEETFNSLIIFGMFPMLLLTIAGREIFMVFFGSHWAEAGVYSQILGPWTFFLFIGSPLSSLTQLHDRQEYGLLLNIFLFVTRIASLWIGGLMNNINIGLQLFTLSGVLAFGWFSLWATSASGVPVRASLKHLGETLGFSAPFLGVVVVGKWILRLDPVQIVSLTFLIGVLYYLFLLKRHKTLKNTLLAIIRKYSRGFPF